MTFTRSPELQAAIIELWGKGLSSTKIGKELGVTRNVVMGHINRLSRAGKLDKDARPPRKYVKRGPPMPANNGQFKRQRKGAPIGNPKPMAFLPAIITLPKPEGTPVFIWELERLSCRYIEGEVQKDGQTLYCGVAIKDEARSFCPYHMQMCYTPVKRKPVNTFVGKPSFTFGGSRILEVE